MKVLLLLLFLIISLNSFCQWRQTEGPITSIIISDIVSTHSAVLTSAPCGTFLSDNGGNSWSPISPETFNASIIFKDTLYLGGENIRKVLQTDKNWIERYSLYKKGKVFDLYADVQKIYAAKELSGFSYSSDGKNWINFNDGLPSDLRTSYPNNVYYTNDVYALDGNDRYIFAGTKKGIFRSAKSNLNWSVLNSNANDKKVNALLCKDSTIFMVSENNIYKSSNNGSSWIVSHTFSVGTTISKLKNINDTIFALTLPEGIYISTDSGNTWTGHNSGLNNLSTYSIAKHKNDFYLATGDGVYRNFSHWENACRHLICSDIIDLEKNDSCLAAVDFYNVSISKDNGSTWTNTTRSIPMSGLWSVVNLNNSFFFSASGPGIIPLASINYLSSDNGDTWIKKPNLTFYDDPYLLRSNGSQMIAVTDDLVFLSEDNGSTWKNISPPVGLMCNNFGDALFVGDHIYIAACGPKEILMTSDYGLHWSFVNEGLPNAEISSLGECQGILFASTNTYLYRKLVGNNYWEFCGKGLPKYNYDRSTSINDFAGNDKYFFLCTSDSIFASNNQGYSWSNINKGLPSLPNYIWGGSLLATDSLLYFGTNNYGVWKLNISDLQLPIDSTTEVKNLFVYPNPTSGMIYFKIPGNDAIKSVDFIDSSGRILQSSFIQGDRINIRYFPKGLYILRILTSSNNLIHSKIIKID